MKRIVPRCGRLFAATVMSLLVGVIALSITTRRPFLQVRSGPWHTYKASHLTESEQHASSVANPVRLAADEEAKAKASPPRYVPDEETLPNALQLAVQKQHFRSPPVLD
jgi:hypothetical protein